MDVWFHAKYMKPLLQKKEKKRKKNAFQSSEDGGVYFIALETTPILLAGSVSYTHNAKDSKGN